MFERIRRLYIEEGKLDEDGLRNAVKRGLITEEQFFTLACKPYIENPGEEKAYASAEEYQKDWEENHAGE